MNNACALTRRVLVAALVALAAACAPTDEVSQHVDELIQDRDDRTDVGPHFDPWLRSVAQQSVVALMTPAMLDASDPDDVRFNAATLGAAQNLCSTERFRDDPAAAFCTGTLIDDDLVLTAGHCIVHNGVGRGQPCSNTRFVFNFHRGPDGALRRVTTADVFSCASVEAWQWGTVDDQFVDYAVLRLDRPATPRFQPAPVAGGPPQLTAGAPVAIAGCGSRIPVKLDEGSCVSDARAATRDHFRAHVDAFAGNSGSGVFDTNTSTLIGVLSSVFFPEYVANGSCNVANRVSSDGNVGSAITYVHRALEDFCDSTVNRRICQGPSVSPRNDRPDRASPVELTAGTEVTLAGSTAHATSSVAAPCGSTNGAPDVFYRFELAQRSVFYADAFGSGYDTVLFLLDAGLAPLPGACNDDACATTQSQLTVVLEPGTYHLGVSGYNGGRGTFLVHVQTVPASRVAVSLDPAQDSNAWANTATSDHRVASACGGGSAPDVTYYWTTCPGFGGGPLVASTLGGASWDTIVSLQQGNTTERPCNDDADGTVQSRLTARATGGPGVRALYVDGYYGHSSGGVTLAVNLPQLHHEGFAASYTPARGAATGSPYDIHCPSGWIMVGLTGRSGALLDAVNPICAHPSNPSWRTGAGTAGGTGGTLFADYCPVGQAVVGIHGNADTTVINRLGIYCAPIGAWDVQGTVGVQLLRRGGAGGSAFSDTCPAGQYATGIAGHADSLVRRISMACARAPSH